MTYNVTTLAIVDLGGLGVAPLVLWSIVLVGAVLIAYGLMILRRYVRIVLNILDEYSPHPENGFSLEQIEGEEVTFRAADGVRLQGIIIPHRASTPARGMVIFAHEFGSVRASCLRYCESLLESGYDLFTFDFRGHGFSAIESGYRPRHWPSDREQADMLGAIAFVSNWLEEQGRPRAVGLFGISRGAGAAIMAAEESADVRAIVVDGAFSNDTLIEYMMKRFATTFARIKVIARNHPAFVWRVLRWMLFRDCARRFNCRFPSLRKVVSRLSHMPILFIQGEKDSYIPVEQAVELHKLARGPKELWVVEGAKHNQSVLTAPREYARRLNSFYDRFLATHPAKHAAPATLRFDLPPITAGVDQKTTVYAGGVFETAQTR